MLRNVSCAHLCTSTLPPASSDFLSSRIRDSYALNWLVDGLPAAEMKRDNKTGDVYYSMGFALGRANPILPIVKTELEEKDWRIEFNNHYDIFLEYHSPDGIHQRVVGVVVWPMRCVAVNWSEGTKELMRWRSIDSLRSGNGQPSCATEEHYVVKPGAVNEVAYTYSVHWTVGLSGALREQ